MRRKPVIFFLGKSGCGKDTQAEFLINERSFETINSGVILRGLKKILPKLKKGSIERYEIEGIQTIINTGLFVPTLTIACKWLIPLLEIVRNAKKINGVVFTGSPRKLAEALLLHEFFINWPDARKSFNVFPLEIKISDKEVYRRLLTRRLCGNCGKIFSSFPEHRILKKCDKCGGKLVRRKDDSRAGIASRLREYNEYVVPVLNYFKKEKILKSVNGEQSIQNVHRDIVKTIGL